MFSRLFVRPLLRPRTCLNLFSTVITNNAHLRIVFGSQSGTAEALAYDLEYSAQEANISTEIIDAFEFTAEDLTVKKDDSRKVVNAFIVACYGDGEPANNAKKFFESLNDTNPTNDATNKLTGSKYAVFGLGNSERFRNQYNAVGKHLDKRLADMGGERLVPLGLGDASITEEGNDGSMINCFNTWKIDLLAAIRHQNDLC